MNKKCTNPECRKTFSTIEFGGMCPHCGKMYPQIEDPLSRRIVSLQVTSIDRTKRIRTIKLFRELVNSREKKNQIGLKEARDTVDGSRWLEHIHGDTARLLTDELGKVGAKVKITRNGFTMPEEPEKPAAVHGIRKNCGLFQKGRSVRFGHYPQTASGRDSTPIEWLVLARRENRALLVSRYALDAQPFDALNLRSRVRYDRKPCWFSCSIRKWLNGTFLNRAFTPSEQACIEFTDTDPGYQDRVFLLSCEEVREYWNALAPHRPAKKLIAEPTAYAVSRGVETDTQNTPSPIKVSAWWWLRSESDMPWQSVDVCTDGSLDHDPYGRPDGAVRPAVWVILEPKASPAPEMNKGKHS